MPSDTSVIETQPLATENTVMTKEDMLLAEMTPKQRKKFLKPPKVRGAWHNPIFTKITTTPRQRRAKNKIERLRRKAGRK